MHLHIRRRNVEFLLFEGHPLSGLGQPLCTLERPDARSYEMKAGTKALTQTGKTGICPVDIVMKQNPTRKRVIIVQTLKLLKTCCTGTLYAHVVLIPVSDPNGEAV